VLHIFGREAWLAEPAPIHFSLIINVAREAALGRLVAEWTGDASREIRAAYDKNGPNAELRELVFYPCGNGLFTRWDIAGEDDYAIALSSSSPPDRLAYTELASPSVSITAGILPACLKPEIPEDWGGPSPLDLASLVSGRLDEGDLAGALRLFTYPRSGIPETEVAAAAREVFAYLARYPLQRDPLLGAFLATLCGEETAR